MNEGTLTVESLAGVLAERFGLTQEQARDFVGKVFSTIQESIERDGLVKVKGLGTFKLVRVEARESVNVNTGERVMIESHAKINFTPDSSIRELVNKPFGSFKTVVLSGTGKGEARAEAAAAKAAEEAARAAEEKAAKEAEEASKAAASKAVEEASKAAEAKEAEEAAKAAEAKEAEEEAAKDIGKDNNDNEENIDKEDESMKKDEEKKVMEEEEDIVEDEDRSTVFWSRMLWTVVVIMLMMGSAYGGYLYGRHEVEEEQEQARLEKQAAEQREDSERRLAAPEERDSTAIPLDATKIGAMDPNGEKKKEEAATTEKSSSASAGKSSAASTTKSSAAKSSDDVVDYKKYEAMDIRVKTGAYRIVGTDKVVTVKKGQTISSISKTYLGPGMECYVEVYNGLKSGEELKEGAKIKIPKLKWKK